MCYNRHFKKSLVKYWIKQTPGYQRDIDNVARTQWKRLYPIVTLSLRLCLLELSTDIRCMCILQPTIAYHSSQTSL